MTGIKPSDHGIVVDHKETEIRFAISDKNYDERVHRKVRDLRAGETVRSYLPRSVESLQDAVESQGGPTGAQDAAKSGTEDASSVQQDAKTEGSASAGTKGK